MAPHDWVFALGLSLVVIIELLGALYERRQRRSQQPRRMPRAAESRGPVEDGLPTV